ncbi:MAG: S-layer homology domain-containing protein [Clostridia bacterium]|nr:S-layer homology domain-containing protein [Clostridia bacterium]
MNKKIITSILAAGFALGSIPAFAQIPQEIKGTRFEKPVSVLSALKIMTGDENGELRLDDTIIRSEVTKMAVTAMGMEKAAESSKGNQDYLDVATDHWANGYINVATSLGLVEGDGDGNFRPNDKITYREAVAIMVRATGYENVAQGKGGYPKGYLSVASENNMLAGVEGSYEKEISRGNVAILTDNTLDVKKMKQTGFGEKPEYSITDKTLLSDNLLTERITGQIKAVGEMTLSGVSSVADGRITIGDKTYKSSFDASNLLGYNVTAYAQKDAYKEQDIILAIPSQGKNTSIEITTDSFSSLTTKNGNDAIEYYPEKSSKNTKTALVDSNAQLIYNNRNVEYSRDKLNIKDKNAYMTLLDTNNDSKSDIVFIREYENMIVNTATATKIQGTNNKIIRLDNVDYDLYQGYNEIAPTSLKKWDVISVIKTPSEDYYEIYMTRNSVKGKVTTTSKDGYTIDGKVYKKAAGFDGSISIGDTAEYLLDINGKIAGIKDISTVTNSYAYLTNAYTTPGDDSSEIKIVDKNGDKMTLTLNSKVKLNGTSKTASSVISELTGKTQLITYTKNSDNKVTEINTANDKSASGEADTDKFTLNKKLENAIYNAQTSKLDNIRITSDSVVFDVSDASDITVTGKDIFSNKQKYTGFVYDMTENFDAGVIVLTDTAFKPETDADAAIVIDMSSGMNSDDEDIDIITLLAGGKEITLNAKDDATLVKGDGKKLETGDIIQYKTNAKNEIAAIRVLFDIDTKNTEFTSEPEEELKLVYGKVTKLFTDSINVTVNNGSAINYTVNENTKIYSIDSGMSKNNINTAEFGDISVFDADENNRIFIRIIDDTVKELIIIK